MLLPGILNRGLVQHGDTGARIENIGLAKVRADPHWGQNLRRFGHLCVGCEDCWRMRQRNGNCRGNNGNVSGNLHRVLFWKSKETRSTTWWAILALSQTPIPPPALTGSGSKGLR